jgi:NADH dehydrogenase
MLADCGVSVTVPARRRERAKHLILLPTVEVIETGACDARSLAALAAGCDAVINLAGVLHSRRARTGTQGSGQGSDRYGPDFAQAHVELAQAVVSACREAGVKRLLHMSALGADPEGPSEYLRSKGVGEAMALAADDLAVSVFRPSVIFGPEDRFLNLFARLTALFPVLGVGSPDARFQPVYVRDVVKAMLAALDSGAPPSAQPSGTAGRRYDLCGPQEFTLRELLAYVCEITGRRRLIVGLPDSLSYLQAWFMEFMPGPLLTRDNYYSMKTPSVCDCAFPFGIQPVALESAAPAWLLPAGPRERYPQLRWRARR